MKSDPSVPVPRTGGVLCRALLPLALLTGACAHPATPLTPATDGEQSQDPAEGSTGGGESTGDPLDDTAALPPQVGEHYAFVNARLPGGESIVLEVDGGLVVSVSSEPPADLAVIDLEGKTVVPGFIDSHVHLAFQYGVDDVGQGAQRLMSGGVVGAVDLAAPLEALAGFDGEQWLAAGPMITAELGYPTQGWGANGYGMEVSGPQAATDAVNMIADLGAKLIKVPVDQGPALSDDELLAIVTRAHERGLLVAAHALGDVEAARAAAVGADILAHTPVEPLSDATIEAWRGRAVISTLRAFGSRETSIENLRQLHAADATVLYGTDLGNLRIEGIDAGELLLLAQAGLTPPQIIASGTSAAASLWGMPGLGALEPGKAATLLVLAGDPLEDPTWLAEPVAVYVDGELVPPPENTPGGFGP